MRDQPRRQNIRLNQKPAIPKCGVMDSIKGYLTNLSYGLQGLSFSFYHKEKQNQTLRPLLFVGGRSFQSYEQCISEHQAIIWFTYRKNAKISLTITSDMGWGCMIRVAQMALAEAIKRYFKAHSIQVDSSYIIACFLQSETSNKYSLSNFLQKASSLFLKKPGDWFSITETGLILQELHMENPLKGTEHLQIMVTSQTIDLSAAQSLLQSQKYQEPSQKFSKKNIKIFISQNKQTLNKSLFLIVTTQLGSKEVSEKDYNFLLDAMTWPWMVGCLGGRPKQARFLTGRNSHRISYLDPHYVQKEVDRINLYQEISKFSCKQYRLMEREDLDPHIGLCFFLKDKADLEGLAQRIQSWKGEGIVRTVRNSAQGKECWGRLGRDNHLAILEDDLDLRSNNSMESSFLMD